MDPKKLIIQQCDSRDLLSRAPPPCGPIYTGVTPNGGGIDANQGYHFVRRIKTIIFSH